MDLQTVGKVTGFVLPLGATVNMDGTALYECVAVIFIAPLYGIQFGLAEPLLLFAPAPPASVGAAGIPHARLVMMTAVFAAPSPPPYALPPPYTLSSPALTSRTPRPPLLTSHTRGAAPVSRPSPPAPP